MPLWFILILLVALYFGMKKGAFRLGSSIANAYKSGKADAGASKAARRSLTSDAVDAGHGGTTRKAASTTAAALGATVSGTRVHAHAARRGFAEGWKEGKAKVLARRDPSKDFVPTGTHATAKEGDGVPWWRRWGKNKGKSAKCAVIVTTHLPDGSIKQAPCGKRYSLLPDPNGVILTNCGAHPLDTELAPPAPAPVRAPTAAPGPGRPTIEPMEFEKWVACTNLIPAGVNPFLPPGTPEHPSRIPCGELYELVPNAAGVMPTSCARCREFFPTRTKENTKENPSMTTPTVPAAPAPATPAPAAPAPAGEVTSMTELLGELERIQKENLAELDDAKADAARATTDMEDAGADLSLAKTEAASIDTMVGCLSRPELKLDPASIGDVSAQIDGAQQRIKLAADRLGAAEARLNLANSRAQIAEGRLAAANKAHASIKARHDVHREAHAASPVPAAGAEFYE
jgi:hypothetical protein